MESTNTTPFLNATEQTSQQEIKKKTQKTLSLDQALTQFARQELSQHHNPKPIPAPIKDTVTINADKHHQTQLDESEAKQKDYDSLKETLKFNAKDILRHLGHKIDFASKKDEFKEMFKHNLQESRSHNLFVSRFARFKVGVVGQILSAIGIPPSELSQLKKDCFQASFDENCTEMTENIYNAELTEIVHGKKQKTKKMRHMFQALQTQLIKKMTNIGRIGYWSKSRILEERINQCKKIQQEFIEEKQHLEYLLHYHQQKKAQS